jgi:hypothetical protein
VQGPEVARKMTFFVTNAITFFVSGQILWDWVLRDEISAWSFTTGMIHFGFVLLGSGYWVDALTNPNAVIYKKDKSRTPSVVESNPNDASKKEAEIQPEKEMPINETKQADNSNSQAALKKSKKKPPLPFNFSEESDPNGNRQPDDSNTDQIKTDKEPPISFNFGEESNSQPEKSLE